MRAIRVTAMPGIRSRTVAAIAPVAGAEWKRYYDDVTWDPDEAKRRTKDDPTKPEVEL